MFEVLEVPQKGKKELIDAIIAYNDAVNHYIRVDRATFTNLSTFQMPVLIPIQEIGSNLNLVTVHKEIDVWQRCAQSQRDHMLEDAGKRVSSAKSTLDAIQAIAAKEEADAYAARVAKKEAFLAQQAQVEQK